MAAALEFLEAQGATRPELAEWYAALADLYQRKLWHQLTLKLDQFLALAVVQAGDALIQLYNHFISDFETKINLLKFAHFTVVVSRQYLDKDAGINYLEGVISKLHDTREARVEEPILRSSENRTIPLSAIAERTRLSVEGVEYLLMKSLSARLIEGIIDQVDGTVHVSWVQPRILGIDQVKSLRDRLDTWVGKDTLD
nr:unnamed protein product [Digitaria exilis]